MRRKPPLAPLLLLAACTTLSQAEAGAEQEAVWEPVVQELEPLLGGASWGEPDEALAAKIDAERRACGERPPRECGSLSLYYSRTSSGLSGEPARAATLYMPACLDGYAWACYLLGELMLREGDRAADAERAAGLHEHACALGESRACLRLGELLEKGGGAAAQPERAQRLYESECEQSRTAGCRALARLLLERRAVDEEAGTWETIRWALDRACSGGNGESCHRLGELLEAASGSDKEVARYFGRACDRNHFPGCLRYARLLEVGKGVSRADPDFARRLYRQACRGGVQEACEAAPPDVE